MGEQVNYFYAFFGGILVSFTPCIFPLIPVTAGYIGAESAGSRIKGLISSLIYVTGIAVTYSLLGILASLTGKIFGAISTHPITHILVGIAVVIFGLSMLDLFSFSLPNVIHPPVLKKKNYFSTFLLGLSSGLMVSPCTTPALGGILTILIVKKNLFYGAALLFCFAYGMGLILILVGTFSALLLSWPKLNKWLVYIKKAGALILVAIGIMFFIGGIRRL